MDVVRGVDHNGGMTRRKSDRARVNLPTTVEGETYQLSELEDLIPVRIVRIGEIFQRIAAAAFERFGLRVTDLRILNALHANEQISVAEISRRARVDKAWISRLVRELEEKALVARTPDPTDSRAMLVSLTPAGRRMQEDILPLARAHETEALAGIDRALLVSMLDRFETSSAALLDGMD